jgi:ribonucleoside-diphosphate reductase alpha chain
MQAAFQKYVDNAVSKTVNFRHEATKEEVEEVFKLAYRLGCKGVTIYRDGSREGQVLNIGTIDNEKQNATSAQCFIPRPRPAITTGLTEKVKIGCGNLYITANYDEKGICEVITNLGRAGGCPSQSEATSRIISIALRSGVKVEAIIEQLRGIRCHSTLSQRAKGNQEIKVLSCPDAIARTLEKLIDMGGNGREPNVSDVALELEKTAGYNRDKEGNIIEKRKDFNVFEGEKLCEECGAVMCHENGCIICKSCGFSKCN